MRVLAIDPSLRSTGYAVLERAGRQVQALVWGMIQPGAKTAHPECLVAIHKRVTELIIEFRPHDCAVEGIIFVQNHKTAIILGAARGAAILAAAQAGLPIHEYAPRRIKQAVVGRGAARKEQVGFMVRALLGLTQTPEGDAADALAIGLNHFNMLRETGDGAAPVSEVKSS
jgi:crossover junction endodeoxyribonuclease RuvC